MTIENDKPMNVAVLGPGGVGGLLAALLARQGDRVVCIARPSTCERLLADGISVKSKRFGDFKASVEAAPELRSPVDVCFVAVKATELGSALDRVSRTLAGERLDRPLSQRRRTCRRPARKIRRSGCPCDNTGRSHARLARA